MTLTAAVGIAQAFDGREAGIQATHQALKKLGMATPSLAIIVASRYYDPKKIADSVSSLLGDTPTIGFSSASALTKDGQIKNSVAVALISSPEIKATERWMPGYAQSGRETATLLSELASATEAENKKILFFADGFNGDAEQMCLALTGTHISLHGGLSSGNPHTGATSQIAGSQASSGSLAAMLIEGNLKMGVGSDHGWRPVGSQFRVTRSRGFWIRALDGRPASEAYSQLFGYPARDWGFPPLNYLVRLYPLGIEQGQELLIRSPLRVEADGSFRMNAPVRDGMDAYLLTGSPETCLEAAQRAAQKARLALGDAKPKLVLVLADIAWQMLLKAQSGAEITAIQDVLGKDIPIIGGYTLGQVTPGKDGSPPDFLNQHITVIAFGEEEKEDTTLTMKKPIIKEE
ncbi:MAG: hypothetical protein HN736_06375 [Anaerolineae bacterium]|jgi:hypothetical protein|nr:hypothetical protein [Anaerolineae bacterium]MBT3713370.1 hypothetical protein [Anaerolineae bacterium]MBT4309395.1 hypothetical protein [Anaerolineae bacterium]MBT4459197.1 hypothetical protein [Anaerolineae bacterium]MBT4840812.1 hypothetical protein [Anaerolineae bacterium]